MGCFILLIGVLTLAFFLKSARAESGLVVQDAEIVPAVAKVGELVSIGMSIKNVGKNTMSCNVTTFCGDCIVGIQEISTIAPKASIPLSFQLNTSNLSTGVYSIEVLIENPSGQQQIYDLGTITIEQDALTTPEDVTEPKLSSTSPAYSNWLYLLPVVPVGAAASVLILRKRRNKSQGPAIPTRQLPYMLNEVLKFEEKVERGTQKTIEHEKEYIC